VELKTLHEFTVRTVRESLCGANLRIVQRSQKILWTWGQACLQ
jgi:hypothetical protein